MNEQQERTLDQVLDTFDITENETQFARVLYYRAFNADFHQRRGSTPVAASAIYTALRQGGHPRSLDVVAAAANVDRSVLGRTYKLLVREFDLDIEPADPHDFVDRFSDRLEISEATAATAHNLIDAATDANIRSGYSPTSTVAGAVYLAGLLSGEHFTQEEVAEAADVAVVTIRDRYQEQAMLLGIDRRAWSPPLVANFDTSPLSSETLNEHLSGFQIDELAADLLDSRAHCTACERTANYEHLLRDHHTHWLNHDQHCFETVAELTELLDGFEVLELANRFHDTRVRCNHCGEEGSYTVMTSHQSPVVGDDPTCIDS